MNPSNALFKAPLPLRFRHVAPYKPPSQPPVPYTNPPLSNPNTNITIPKQKRRKKDEQKQKQSLFDIALRFQQHLIDHPSSSYLSPITSNLQTILYNHPTINKPSITSISIKATELATRFDKLRKVLSMALERMDQVDSCIAVSTGKIKQKIVEEMSEEDMENWVRDVTVHLAELEEKLRFVEGGLDQWRRMDEKDGEDGEGFPLLERTGLNDADEV